ncbi:hypothetical protein [Nonlabens ulvanivorans]|uniref:hypothetical protein n=1 Tax=Nonlabens ulvanivorans TaxID=906888 RepID=UPI00294389C0|nr:hypothetical protein [Nonlabens ulvanivorans]WOI21580.1 hypothetical protein R1T42_07780 [Nonlabens ulvanivorans]
MKNLFLKLFFCSIISITISSCTINSLEEDDLTTNNKSLTILSDLIKIDLYISWEPGTTEDQKNHVREQLTHSNSLTTLHSFYIDETIHNGEIWQLSSKLLQSDTTDPILWIEDEDLIKHASFEPF